MTMPINQNFWKFVHKHRCLHPGQEVVVGSYTLQAGASLDRDLWRVKETDILIALTEFVSPLIWLRGFTGVIRAYPLQDYGGVLGPWKEFLNEMISELEAGKRIFVFCEGGHGRTGTFLASLVALLEKPEDPIASIRHRYCKDAVETIFQGEAIFSIMDSKLPEKYYEELLDENQINALIAVPRGV